MKKLIYLPLLLLTLFVSVNKVNADNTYNTLTDFYNQFPTQYDIMSTYQTEINNLIDYWNNNLRNISSEYVIVFYDSRSIALGCDSPSGSPSCYSILLFPLTSTNFYFTASGIFKYYDTIPLHNNSSYPYEDAICIGYNLYTSSYFYKTDLSSSYANIGFGDNLIRSMLPLKSSSPLVAVKSPNNDDTTFVVIPSYTYNNFSFPQYYIDEFDYFPTLDTLVNGIYDPSPTANYVEINTNNYDYIILSLKNYNQTSFRTDLYVSGQLCLTPVYNYGMTEKKDIVVGSKNQECSITYNSLSRVGMSISQNDIDNHSVYYIKAPINNISNIIKVDTSIFDITYITSQNASDPQVVINGRSYPVIPYDNLTDTAIISTNEGYISGQVCSVGDINCNYENNIGLDISDIFTQPLKVLQSVWTSITSVFILIGQFIALIPSPLKEFLIASFMLAIILGILKIIL